MKKVFTVVDENNQAVRVLDGSHELSVFVRECEGEGSEYFEILDEKGVGTGILKNRKQIHKQGDIHGAFHHFDVKRLDDGDALIIFQKRNNKKDVNAGKMSGLVGGHFAFGENFEDGVIREIKEEVGVDVRFSDLTHLGARKKISIQPAKDTVNREFQDVTICITDRDYADYSMQESELDAIIGIRARDLVDMFTEKTETVSGSGIEFVNGVVLPVSNATFARGNFIVAPITDNYYLKLAIFVLMHCNGESLPSDPFKTEVVYYL